ncbi:response regulator transcription factor [Pullulanibacillus sp. KACC 23026]|uniref:response regulator transcription factor n=1 Tax=Pullulanibacillus sp. KACC 23026 TaxID=3028315 RepID=UPI0023B1E9FE|nr:response regulator transcription factor [Pullulanibacillus sp. KACC 23026]WEG13807.1 response regulator transcription factor [Pullulanibacillus sp. KACC 23026]
MKTDNHLKIVIADDHAIVRSGVKLLVEKEEDMQVIALASQGQEAVDLAIAHQPDVVIMDISMPPGMDGLEATKSIKKQAPDCHVLILTMHDEPDYLFKVLNEGASGYMLKQALDYELIAAIRAVANGDVYLYPTAAKWIVGQVLESPQVGGRPKVDLSHLSEREEEVLTYIARGFANKEISEELYISVKTVETHKKNIMEKLGLSKRHELVDYALKKGLLK